jgi:hypothetical protein
MDRDFFSFDPADLDPMSVALSLVSVLGAALAVLSQHSPW